MLELSSKDGVHRQDEIIEKVRDDGGHSKLRKLACHLAFGQIHRVFFTFFLPLTLLIG